LPFALSTALLAATLFPSVSRNPGVRESFWAAGALLLLANVVLLVQVVLSGRRLVVDVKLRKQHYIQACAQLTVLLYWGWYWREVYQSGYLIAAQLIFAYAFDMLLSWSRRDSYTLGFAPVPIVFSINLFLWFKPNWFWLQFLMVAVAFTAKEFVRWQKDGRRVHIFNPSAFSLGLFSLGLILTGNSDLTWGREVATTLNYAPDIYLLIFLVGLPGQFLFGVTSMTLSAVVTIYAAGLLYFNLTGVYFFFDSYIPAAVFLGMHLLFTDPATSPRTDVGRVLFGMVYAVSVMALYAILARVGAPTFYDKLLAVPIMNLIVKGLDQIPVSKVLMRAVPTDSRPPVTLRRQVFPYMAIWVGAFVMLSMTHAVGDSHRGRWVPFWQEACEHNRPNACRGLAIMLLDDCSAGSGWACNEYGILLDPAVLPERASYAFEQACALGFSPGCDNRTLHMADAPQRAAPTLADYRIIVRERSRSVSSLSSLQLYQRGCTEGFLDGCENACRLGDREACSIPLVGAR